MAIAEADSDRLEEDSINALVERNKTTNWADLSAVDRAFVHEYMNGYNHREAAAITGRAKNRGISLLRDPLIASYIAHLQNQSHFSSIITKDFINMHYMKLLGYAMGEEEMPIVLATGEQTYGKKVMVGEAKNILSEMAKSTEYEKDTGAKTAPVSISINLGNLFGPDTPVISDTIIEGEIVE